jgi:DNA segregation ATPase FtsK/SpoIIIE-like protein
MSKTTKKKVRTPHHSRFRFFLVHLGLALALLLLLVASAASGGSLRQDAHALGTCAFLDVLRLHFPPVQNPIGPLGVWGALGVITVFGHFYAIILLGSLIVLQCFYLFQRERDHLRWGMFHWLLFALFATFTWVACFEPADNFAYFIGHDLGLLSGGVFLFASSLLRQTGAIIAFTLLTAGFFVLLVRMRNLKALFGEMFSGMASWRESGPEPRPVERKVKVAKVLSKPAQVSPISFDDEDPVLTPLVEPPRIVDHVRPDDDLEVESIPIPAPQHGPAPKRVQPPADGEDDNRPYVMPDINMFLSSPPKSESRNREQVEDEIRQVSQILREKLAEFGIEAQVMNVNIGPIITQYELKPAPGVKVSRFPNLADDLALAIKAKSIRVQAPIPGKGLIGIEVPNPRRDTIYLKDILLSEEMRKQEAPLAFALGKDISGSPLVSDLTKMPHLLIAGATGAGKSVCINTTITSLLLTQDPDHLRLVLIDPKRIELSGYEGIPHLIQNVVTDPEEALMVLNWAVSEMERRYQLLQKYNVRDIAGYNQKIKEDGEDDDEHLPYIVIIVDEFADLIMTAGREIELPLARLAQMARAIGIHLILATQRPSIKVITGIIKANFPARIAFQVSSKMDSRVILDANGAERLLGRGDMLFLPPGKGTPERIHGAFVSDHEIERIVEYLRDQPKPKTRIEMIKTQVENLEEFEYDDDLFPEAARAVVSAGAASVSMLQRHFKIGYARAGRLVDLLERAGVVGAYSGSKSREVMMTGEDLERHGY